MSGRGGYDKDFDAHRLEASVEDARFLLSLGEPIERVARRLGLPVGTLERRIERDEERRKP